jgi:hypothetical protein
MSSRLQELLSRPTLDDVVAGVLAASEMENIPSRKAGLHKFFQETFMRDDLPADFNGLLDPLSFAAGDWCPFSRELEAALMRLQIGRLISASNPDYRWLSMSAPQRERAMARIERLPGVADKEFIVSAARRFKETADNQLAAAHCD